MIALTKTLPVRILEPVFIRNVCGFSSIILLQTRQKCAGGLSPGKYFSRSMQQNLPKRHVYTLVKTGSYKERSENSVMSEQFFVQHILTEPQLCYFSRQFSNMFGLPVRLYRQQEEIYTYSPVQLAADPVTLCIAVLLQETAPLGYFPFI